MTGPRHYRVHYWTKSKRSYHQDFRDSYEIVEDLYLNLSRDIRNDGYAFSLVNGAEGYALDHGVMLRVSEIESFWIEEISNA